MKKLILPLVVIAVLFSCKKNEVIVPSGNYKFACVNTTYTNTTQDIQVVSYRECNRATLTNVLLYPNQTMTTEHERDDFSAAEASRGEIKKYSTYN